MEITNSQKTYANAIARKNGCGRATEIRINPNITEGRVVGHTRYGYRKYTTGAYIPNAYRANFGWKNTYYQNAETIVEIPASIS